MSTIRFKKANCKNCYKCIRSCPVKAISFKDDQAQIIENGCILCGNCLKVCSQNAKSVESDLEKVKGFIDKKFKIYASIAPSFAAAFDIKDERAIFSIFKKLGFTHVEETTVGASKVSFEYEKLLLKREMRNIITSACPTIVSLIENYYPELIDELAPVVSPMIAHGKMLKEKYGSRIKVVFIGPCISKKEEFKDSYNDDVIDAVVTFEEFENWMKEEQLSFEIDENVDLKACRQAARYYPAPGGIIKSLGRQKDYQYRLTKVDGIERCIDIIDEIKSGDIKGYFIEMNSCVGGCLGGPCMNSGNTSFLKMKERLLKYINRMSNLNSTNMNDETKVEMTKKFKDKSKSYLVPDEETISSILRKIGKYSKEQELNCGACGYSTCREKAVAVFNCKAELHMCVPYMRERAESISNVIIHSTPNAIFALNEEFQIQEANLAARRLFKFEEEEYQQKNIFEILDCVDIVTVNETEKDILNKKYHYKYHDVVVEQSILYLKENHMMIIIMKDITKDEKKEQQLHKVRCETVDIAQKVIDKQMRVAQEIASLLGETTAETKVALTKLKKSIQAEMGEEI